ncbi:MAG: CoA-binding protein [Pelotomaculum sp.]|uniref:Acyl-CoA synthetase n=1 Tax=Pelotomaculum thermopropionicum (strain DSM 13744 / JCM 10971 / SI) TaxID=370438 RepID=A5D530_PELTS|nr:CoA-binding protein [Pelotomaculum sp.]BAF58671.1 acyl-CoA synthetase [Pelotomaculum thermopropionicum SI]
MSRPSSFTRPKSVAVIGASNKPGKIGCALVSNLIESGYQGRIFPVNSREKEILGLPCFPSVADIPEEVETAVFAVPAPKVLDAAAGCGRKGVKNLVVLTAGFKEMGREGMELEKKFLGVCKEYGMRMLGPNCVGFLDTHTPINATFLKGFPARGEIAFISQSGAMLAAILDWSKSAGIGYSKIYSLGNKADLNEVDCIAEAADDPNTKVILCYIEDVACGPEFLRVVSQATRKKPVIILKSGTSQAGAQAASSHTGALAGSDLAYNTAFKRCGVIRVDSMSELFDLAIAFVNQPVPKGRKVAIVTNSGGPGIIATDKVEAHGLTMARFTKDTIEELRLGLPPEAGIYNPVDVLGDARADRFKFALEKVLRDENVDGAAVLLCPVAVTQPVETAQALIELNKAFPEKPLIAAYMGGQALAEGVRLLTENRIPCFTMPEPAIAALAGMVKYREMTEKPEIEEKAADFRPDQKTVKAVFYDVKKDNRLALLGSEAAEVIAAYGVAAVATELSQSPEEAAAIADRIGYPVVLKVASPKILHKTDVGGVITGIRSAGEVKSAYVTIMENVHRYLPRVIPHGIEVQKMVPKGVELIVGMTRDVQFGPLIGFGLGGIYVNLLKDVSFRLAHGLTGAEIAEMIAETKAYTLIKGYRGENPVDLGAVSEVIRRTAMLAVDFPEIMEIDINPVFAYEHGVAALDVKITLS